MMSWINVLQIIIGLIGIIFQIIITLNGFWELGLLVGIIFAVLAVVMLKLYLREENP